MRHVAIASAPRWRRMLAGLTDAGVVWLAQRSARRPGGPELDRRWVPVLESGAELVREQLGSPGQWLLGLRTVDARTGRRVQLWRSLVLLAAAGSSRLVVPSFPPDTPEQARQREQFIQEMADIHERHPQPSPERDAERLALFERHRSPRMAALPRALAPMLAAALVNRGLRRRLAPTRQVLVRGR